MSLKRIRFSDWRVYVPVAALLIVASIGIYMTQEPDRPKAPHYSASDLVKDCPPDHLIEFVLPQERPFYVNIRWLDTLTIGKVFDQVGSKCPTMPVRLQRLGFNSAVLRLLDIQTGLGEPIFRLGFSGLKTAGLSSSSFSVKRIERYVTGAQIEVNTPLRVLERGPGRFYYLHYPDEKQPPANVICSGPEGRRLCEASPGYRFDGLGVKYILSQPQLPMPDPAAPASTDPSTEPGAIFQFDTRLRAWIRQLQEKPS